MRVQVVKYELLRSHVHVVRDVGAAALAVVLTIAGASLVDQALRKADWSIGLLAVMCASAAIIVGASVGLYLARRLRAWEAALWPAGFTILFALALAAQWNPTPGTLDCPGTQSCEAGFAVGGLLIAILLMPVGMSVSFLTAWVVGARSRRSHAT